MSDREKESFSEASQETLFSCSILSLGLPFARNGKGFCSGIHETTTSKSKIIRGISFFAKVIHQTSRGLSVFIKSIYEIGSGILVFLTGIHAEIEGIYKITGGISVFATGILVFVTGIHVFSPKNCVNDL